MPLFTSWQTGAGCISLSPLLCFSHKPRISFQQPNSDFSLETRLEQKQHRGMQWGKWSIGKCWSPNPARYFQLPVPSPSPSLPHVQLIHQIQNKEGVDTGISVLPWMDFSPQFSHFHLNKTSCLNRVWREMPEHEIIARCITCDEPMCINHHSGYIYFLHSFVKDNTECLYCAFSVQSSSCISFCCRPYNNAVR